MRVDRARESIAHSPPFASWHQPAPLCCGVLRCGAERCRVVAEAAANKAGIGMDLVDRRGLARSTGGLPLTIVPFNLQHGKAPVSATHWGGLTRARNVVLTLEKVPDRNLDEPAAAILPGGTAAAPIYPLSWGAATAR